MYSFYRGTPFNFVAQVQDDGVIQDLTNASLQANVYDPTGTTVIATLTCTVLAPATNGIVNISAPGPTTNWPIGKARVDFLLYLPNNNGLPLASDPVPFRIAQAPMIG